MKVIRHIHPIGQGAFYTERFVNDDNTTLANVVYDCGCGINLSQNIKAEKLISATFDKEDTIDVLFISHFDADHVNGVKSLMKRKVKIKFVVMPFVAPEEIELVEILVDNEELKRFVKTPESFFSQETIIIKVNYIRDNEIEKDADPIYLEEYERHLRKEGVYYHLDSFQSIKIKSIKSWIYIPFNFDCNRRIKVFKEKLKISNIELTNDISIFDKYNASDIKKIYEQVKGKANGNSLGVYSGFYNEHDKCKINNCYITNSYSLFFYKKMRMFNSVAYSGCLYLGDSNLNENDENGFKLDYYLNNANSIKKYLSKICLIQIPHHGSIDSFSNIIFSINKDCHNYFLSYGDDNNYGHPSGRVIEECLSRNYNLFCVNQQKDSRLIQIIEL